jgi:ketosteroid isomerase-like protein
MDIEEIKKLQNKYLFWINEKKWDNCINCFTDDAVAYIPSPVESKGKAAIAGRFRNYVSKMNLGKDRDKHYAIMPIITVEGDKAKGEWLLYILITDKETGKAGSWIQGKYENEYSKVNGKWKISHLKWLRGWPDNIH